tara:strand:- start:506 stop:1678 length:1173 start_codon:yes stop_codon:yes gene_type:complete
MSEFFVPKKIPKEAMEYINKKGYQLIFAKDLQLLSNIVTRNATSRKTHANHFTRLKEKMLETCKKSIGKHYFNRIFNVSVLGNTNIISLEKDFDIVIVIKGNKKEDVDPDNIVAFLVTQVGECKTYEYVDALNLICSNDVKGSPVGRIVFYLYIFTLKYHKIDKGLLELAGSYENISGLCLYNKFGFRENFSLMNRRCFPDEYNLPMYVDMTDRAMNNENMLNALTKSINIPVSFELEEPLCKKGTDIGINGKGQKKAIKRRMDNHDIIADMKQNNLNDIKRVGEINKIRINPKDTQDIIINKIAQKSKKGEAIIKEPRELSPTLNNSTNSNGLITRSHSSTRRSHSSTTGSNNSTRRSNSSSRRSNRLSRSKTPPRSIFHSIIGFFTGN